MKHILYLIFAGILISEGAVAQTGELSYLSANYSKFLPERVYSNEMGQKYNLPQYYSHPDFGKLTSGAPLNKKVVEVLAKRTLVERYYVDLDNPTYFYIQKASMPINFYKNGNLLAIDPSLKSKVAGVYTSESQPCPTELNITAKKSSITFGNDVFTFNDVTLEVIKNDNSVELFAANWNNIKVGNNGAYITNVFPGIDMKMMYKEAGVEADFIIRQNLYIKKLRFIDHYGMPLGYSFVQENGVTGASFKGAIAIVNTSNQHIIEIGDAIIEDASGEKTHGTVGDYQIVNHAVSLSVDSAYLNNQQTVYPVTVDPLVTVVAPVASAANLMGSLEYPSFCSNTINVTFPASTKPWDVGYAWEVRSRGCGTFTNCWNSEALIWFTNSCGRSPAAGYFWKCVGCTSTGDWVPTLSFGSDASTTSMMTCYPASCSSQNIAFTINFGREYCSNGNCAWSSHACNRLYNWSVTVQGRSMETQGNTTTGNGTTAVSAICFAGQTLSPTVLYGVAAYTYNWSPGGETTSSKTIPTNYVGSQAHVCTVTDACGVSRTATFNVTTNCVLPVELVSFNGAVSGRNVELYWKTATEANSSHFTIERSYDAMIYTKIATVKAAGNSTSYLSYRTLDESADLNRIVYYRLKQFDNGAATERFSTVIDIEAKAEVSMDVFPNPGNGLYEIIPSGNYSEKAYDIIVYDYTGKEVLKQTGLMDKSPLSLVDYPSGMYLLKVTINGKMLNKSLVKQ